MLLGFSLPTKNKYKICLSLIVPNWYVLVLSLIFIHFITTHNQVTPPTHFEQALPYARFKKRLPRWR